MSIVLQSSGGGQITLQEPTTASNFTQTLPAATGSVALLDGSNNFSVAGNLSFNSGFGSAGVAYGCRAWVNFNGEGTPSIRGSGNVSSITDNGTGQYTVNFATAMPDTNYSAVGGGGGSVRNNTLTNIAFPNNLRAVGSLGIDTQFSHTTAFDPPFVAVAVFR